MSDKYHAMVIDNDMQARMRLKAATTSVATFGNVKLVATLDETLRSMEGGGHTDIVFIANRFPQKDITEFIKNAKGKTSGQDSAYVLVLKTDDQDSNTVAQNVLVGADGFLLEPYSVDQLVEITHLASRVRRERSQEREAAALAFLLKDVIKNLDRLAYVKSCGIDVGRIFMRLKDMCAVFTSLSDESREIYFEVAVKSFIDAPVPILPQRSYKGVSDRVRKKMEAKILAELEADLGADEPVAATPKEPA